MVNCGYDEAAGAASSQTSGPTSDSENFSSSSPKAPARAFLWFARTGHLVLHDTTEFSYHREDIRSVGILHRLPVGGHLNGQLQHYVVCGIQMHSSLAVTTDGLPLGLTAMKF